LKTLFAIASTANRCIYWITCIEGST